LAGAGYDSRGEKSVTSTASRKSKNHPHLGLLLTNPSYGFNGEGGIQTLSSAKIYYDW